MEETKDSALKNIFVAVRCRPFLRRELEINNTSALIIKNLNSLVLSDPTTRKTKEKLYKFDRIFQETSKQSEIFKETTESLVDSALDGFNSTVFAYGPTGTGKTFTMFGENERLGLIQMAVYDVFDKVLAKSERIYTVLLSYVEIYNEVLKDLLSSSSGSLDIREDPAKGIIVSDLFEARVTNAEQVVELIRNGNKMRTVESTEQNIASSRSHGIIMINIEFIDKCSGIQSEVFSSKFFLIDLAGSERASKNKGIRQIEGANINRSLLALGNCITALSDLNSKGLKGFVPYRDSKLTRILKDSLGGKCKTAMIACVAPCSKYYDDTYNTLEYANRVKNIRTRVEKNVLSVDHHVVQYKQIINDLRAELKELKLMAGQKFNFDTSTKADDVRIDLHLKELADHFALETKTKMKTYEKLAELDGLTEELILTENKKNAETQEEKIDELKKNIKKSQILLKKLAAESSILERKRKEFEFRWDAFNEETLAKMKINFQKYVIRINEMEKEQDRIHEESLVKQKDLYIDILREKLSEKLKGLEKNRKGLISPFETFDKNPSIFISKSPELDISSPLNKIQQKRFEKSLKSDSFLPPVSPLNRIEKYSSKEAGISRLKGKNYESNSPILNISNNKKSLLMNRGKSLVTKNKNFNIFAEKYEKNSNKLMEVLRISEKALSNPLGQKKPKY